jgi:sulfur carrier protein ThiS
MDCIINGIKKRVSYSGSVKGLLDKLDINEQIVLVKRNGEIITELDNVGRKDKVEIQKVILGG